MLRRTVLLVVLGLALNGFPEWHWATLRLPGILQRIGICYGLVSLLFLGAEWVAERRGFEARRVQVGVLAGLALALLAGYGLLLKVYPVPGFGAGRFDSLGTLAAVVDRRIIPVPHLWAYGTTPGYGVTYDPEGLVSTLGALATTLLGVLAGLWLRGGETRARKAVGMVVAGVVLFGLGLLLAPVLPINKRIYTPSFALLSGGVTLMAFAGFYALLDVEGWRSRLLTPALVLGTNAILAFTVSTVITDLLTVVHVGAVSLHGWIYARAFAPYLGPARVSSLAYAVVIVAVNCWLIWPLYRRRIFVRL